MFYIPEIYSIMIAEDKVTTSSLLVPGKNDPRFDWEAFVSASRKNGWKQLGDRQNKFANIFVNRIPRRYYGGTRNLKQEKH